MAFMPNGRHSALHVGHVWILSHILKQIRAVETDLDMFDVQFVLYVDGVFNRYTERLVADLKYVGMLFNDLYCLRDWTALVIEYSKQYEPPFQVFAKIGHDDIMAKLARMFFFKERGVRVHVRGDDLLGFSGYEKQLADLMGWPYPRIIYVPLLVDANEEKIGKWSGTADEYLVETYRNRKVSALKFKEALDAAISKAQNATPSRRNIVLPLNWFGNQSERRHK